MPAHHSSGRSLRLNEITFIRLDGHEFEDRMPVRLGNAEAS